MGFFDIFFGSTQSKFTAYAIMAAIIAICITIILTRTDMTMGNRLLLILFVILTLVPSIFLILFEITCMVTGGNKNERWWCWLYAWIVAAFIIIYCILIIIISFTSLFTYNNAIEKVEIAENQNKMSPQNSNDYAKAMIETNQVMERFENKIDMTKLLDNLDEKTTPENILNTLDVKKEEKEEENFNPSKEVITKKPEEKKKEENKKPEPELLSEKTTDIEPFIGGFGNFSSY
jgi:nitrogen fixation/metabolism regulation signal transduction histidine kinase